VDEIINSAGVQDDGTNGSDLNPADNNAIDTTAVIAAPDLQLNLTTAITTAEPGEVVTYNLSYSNIGTQDALGTTINETVPAHMLFDAAHSSAGWNCPDGSVAGTVCTITVGEVGESGAVDFAVTIDLALAVNMTVTNTAVLADDGSNGTDLNLADNVASLSLFIHANDDPIALDDSQTTDEDTAITLDVLANDSDPDGNELTVTAVTQPANGAVVLNPSTGSGQTITYTPDADYNSSDSAGAGDTFTYTVNDGHGGTATAAVSVTVNPVNDEPVAVGDNETTNEDTPIVLEVLANDTDVDGDTLTITAITTPTLGSVVNNGDGTLTYTPAAETAGTDSFSYTVADGNGGTASALVTIEVVSANDAPTAEDDSAVVDEDISVIIFVLDNDSDIDGDTVLLAAVNAPANGMAAANGDGTVTYTPNANFNGLDSFSYTVDDGQGAMDSATVTVTVNPVNDAPAANDDIVGTLEDTPVIITVLENDEDIDNDPLAVTITAAPANGSTLVNGDGTVTYTPAASYNGPDSFGYTIDDGLETDPAVVTITVTPDNDNPTAVDDEATTLEDTAVTFDVLSNDSDIDGDTITITVVTTPTNGSIVLNPDGMLTYTPTADFNGDDSVVYTVVDGFGGADTAVAVIHVTPVNDDPVAQDDGSTTNEDTAVTLNVLDNDADVDGDALTVTAVTTPTNGTVVVNPENSITYTPTTNFNGDDSFGYTIADGFGGSSSAVVTIHVNPVNDSPVAVDDTAALDEDTAVTIAVLDNDSDVDGDTLTVTVVTTPTNGTAVINPDSTIRYVPAADFNGADDFDYTIGDGNGGFATASVIVVVNAVNDAPVAADDEAMTAEDSATAILVLNNDSDVDADDLTISNVTVPAHGTAVLNADGSILYTPAANFNGEDSFNYTLSDESGLVDTALVMVTVTPVNDAPFAFDDTASVDANNAVVIPVLDNDSDGDGDVLVVDSITQPANGTAVTNPDNTITYIPDSGFSGVDTFTYTISDGNGGIATATVTVTVMAGECTIDFDTDAMGSILLAGTFINEQWAAWGVHLTSPSANHPLMIFDSANPTGGDNDLQSPGYGNNNVTDQGNILILSEDGDPNDPDDNDSGGDLIFTFDQPVFIRSVGLLDIDSYNNKVKV
jgi:glycerol uptake facilitator-like aquaporin